MKLDGVNIISVPAVHFSSRGLFDHDATLWSGYVFESPLRRVYFAGDTAYHETLFQQLRQTIGPVDVALVPIGAYEPRKLMADVHTDPEEAVALGHDMALEPSSGCTGEPWCCPRNRRSSRRVDFGRQAWRKAIPTRHFGSCRLERPGALADHGQQIGVDTGADAPIAMIPRALAPVCTPTGLGL